MNTACAYEIERQNKKKCQDNKDLLQSSRPMLLLKKMRNRPLSRTLKFPVVLSQFEEIKSEMALLKDLKAEVSQIRESMQQPQHMPRQPPPAGGADGVSGLQFPAQQMQDLAQGYWFTLDPRHRGGTAQYQQAFLH